MSRPHLILLLCCTLTCATSFGQKKIFTDDFKNNKNGWRLQDDTSFVVDIKNGVLHLEKKTKNFFSRGCLWYSKAIPGFSTAKDFSIDFSARFVSGGDISDVIDLQWGYTGPHVAGRSTSILYQITLLLKGELRLEYFNKGWKSSVRKKVSQLWGKEFDPKQFNNYSLEQKDSIVIFRINGHEVVRHLCPPVEGNVFGVQQCLKSVWEMDKIVVRQGPEKHFVSADTVQKNVVFSVPDKEPSTKELLVYPNPFRNSLRVSFRLEKEEAVRILLEDMNGQVLQQHQKKLGAGVQQVQLYADVPAGSYVVQVQTDSTSVSAVVVKQ